jgi:protein-tyrosine phosphatase
MRHANAMASSPASDLPPARDPDGPYRVCLVCLGNICRSPMAETVLRDAITAAGLDGAVAVDSAGTGDWHIGEQMDASAREALSRRGYDGSAHRARQIESSWLPQYDLILAMDRNNLHNLRRMAAGTDTGRIRLFGPEGGLTEPDGGQIPDPWGGGAEQFDYVLGLLRRATPVIARRLARLLESDDAPA